MVKWLKQNQNKLVLVIGIILVAASAFAGGMLFSGSEQKEPLSLSEIPGQETLSLSFDTVDGSVVLSKTDPGATVKQGDQIVPSDQEGRFQFNFNQGTAISVFNESNLINLDLRGFSAPQIKVENLGNIQGTEDIRVAAPKETKSQEQTDSVRANQGSPAQETPKTGQFVGSKNSDKYHLPSCRWVKKIKEANQVWFSSTEEAASKGYKPCSQCLK